ncbi:MAG TPA: hypothetical protein ENK83_02800, partial [Aliiroseovarius sp.]|nr:hypothetical protein [Aliiroseovarius sp.]
MRFSVRGTVRSTIDALDFAISDMALVQNGGDFTVIVHSGPNGGLSSYALNATGTATLVDTAMFNPTWALGISADLALIDDGWGGVSAVFGMTSATQLGGFSVAADGAIGSVTNFGGLTASIDHCNALAATPGNDLLIAGAGTGFSAFTPSGTSLTPVGNVADTVDSLVESVSILAQVDVDGTQIVIAGSDTEHGITSYVRAANTLTLADVSGPDQGLGLMVPTDIATTEVAGTDYAIVATAQGNAAALSVFQIAADGALTATDHVLDTRDTRFGAVQAIEVIQHNGISFVVAGGGDDGLSLFALMGDGKLQLLDTIVDTTAIGLANVSSIVGASLGDSIRLLIGSRSEGRLTDLSIDLSDLGSQLRASAGGSPLTGTGGDDFLIGLGGNDTLDGGQGADTLVDGAGSDTLTGGNGRDVFVLRDDGAADTITDFNLTYDRLDLSSWPMFHDPGSLTINTTSTGATITWREETLHVFSANGQPLAADELRQRVIEGINRPMDISGIEFPDNGEYDFVDTDGDDVLRAGAGDQSIAIGYGDDTVFAGAGNDVIVNGQGINRIFLEDGDDTFSDQNTSTADDGDIVYGGGGNDDVTTGIGADQVFGGSGNDTIRTDDGSDYVEGGSGSDMVWLGGGDDQFEEDDTESAGEADEVYGGDGNDTLDGGGGDDSLEGEAGDDLLKGGSGNDTLRGGVGNDEIRGGLGNDRLEGGDGNDVLRGGSENDTLFGGIGQDTLDGGTGDDTMDGGAGNDTLTGADGHDTLTGADGDDHLEGGAGRDRLHGGEGGDTLDGGSWSDWLFGDAGDDVLIGDSGDDVMTGGVGSDRLDGGTGRDTLNGGDGDDWLDGGLWSDWLFGDAGDDELIGNNGDDEIHGGLGNDTITGGDGMDRIFGDE